VQASGAQEILAAGKWTITWRQDGLRVLLTLPSEDYVVAALNGEAAPDEPLASLKAMAISMRTFALVNANRHGTEGFGLCDSTHCQALRLGRARPEVERAVRETAGETLWFDGQRAQVYYTQHCGGMSEPSGLRSGPATWRGLVPILTACADPQRSGTPGLRSISSAGFFAPKVGRRPPRSSLSA
jgi:stage II sporulation protein D